ncbi:hypothetical protein V1264_005894 [Littorina saxatilis]|uniref:SWIM-type domain-containing protein n=1 Tax=Littorina saxatilis TaxID=31220 RepID=A0AAN9G5X6_9CAEN
MFSVFVVVTRLYIRPYSSPWKRGSRLSSERPKKRYATCRRSVWKITIDENNQFFCNCPEFLKCYVCHHSMGMEIRLEVTNPPAQAKTIPIGQKRKRGRPKLSRPALIRQ